MTPRHTAWSLARATPGAASRCASAVRTSPSNKATVPRDVCVEHRLPGLRVLRMARANRQRIVRINREPLPRRPAAGLVVLVVDTVLPREEGVADRPPEDVEPLGLRQRGDFLRRRPPHAFETLEHLPAAFLGLPASRATPRQGSRPDRARRRAPGISSPESRRSKSMDWPGLVPVIELRRANRRYWPAEPSSFASVDSSSLRRIWSA